MGDVQLTLDLEFAHLSDPGKQREHNEDYLGHVSSGLAGAGSLARLAVRAGGWRGRAARRAKSRRAPRWNI